MASKALSPFFKTISANLQPIPHALLEGEEEVFLTGETTFKHRWGQLELELSPRGFIQTNTNVAAQLYETAGEWVKELPAISWIDLYCGHGPFAFTIAKYGLDVQGVEINPHAIDLAKKNASHLGSPTSFTHADSLSWNGEMLGGVIVNPPRAGLKKLAGDFLEKRPQWILYSSCSPEALERDLGILKNCYEITRAQLFNMFPRTEHFESLVLLKLRRNI